jgi:hypothetical protein
MFQNLSAKFDKFWTMGRSPFWISKFGRFESPWNFEMELGPPGSLTRHLTVHTGHWPRAHSPSAGLTQVIVHHAPTAGSPAAVISRAYPRAWPGRGRPLPFRSYRDHVAALSLRTDTPTATVRANHRRRSRSRAPAHRPRAVLPSSSRATGRITQRSSARPPRC